MIVLLVQPSISIDSNIKLTCVLKHMVHVQN